MLSQRAPAATMSSSSARRSCTAALVARPRPVAVSGPRRAREPTTRVHASAALRSVDLAEPQTQAQEVNAVSSPAAVPAPRKAGGGGHKGSSGPFAPLVVAVKAAMGEKDFNKFRGKAISLHSQVIKEFGKTFGVENRQVQGIVRLAKKNGEWLGFLA